MRPVIIATAHRYVKSTAPRSKNAGIFPLSLRKLLGSIEVGHKMFATHRLLMLLYLALPLKIAEILALQGEMSTEPSTAKR